MALENKGKSRRAWKERDCIEIYGPAPNLSWTNDKCHNEQNKIFHPAHGKEVS
jgi:hypothetical protein